MSIPSASYRDPALDACPFCGGNAKLQYDGEWGRWDLASVNCLNLECEATGPNIRNVEGYDTAMQAAADTWNRRSPPR